MIWPFSKRKEPWQKIIIESMNNAMSIRLSDHVNVFNGCPTNNLEAVIALFWMVEHSLDGLTPQKRKRAGSFLMDELLAWFEQDYSRDEIFSLVIPCFERRLDEYEKLFSVDADEKQSAIMNTCQRIVTHVFGEEEPHIAQTTAVLLLWWKPISQHGNKIVNLDKQNLIDWKFDI